MLLLGPSTAAEIALIMPRKVLRFDFRAKGIGLLSLILFLHDGGNAVDFDQRIARKPRNRNRGASRTTIRKISFEDGVHTVVVVKLCQENCKLKDAVHRAAARLD